MSCSPASVKLKTNKVKRMVTGDINAPTNMLVVKDKLDKKQYIDLAAERLAEKGSSCKVIHKKAKDIKEQSYEQTTEELAYELMRKNVKYKDMSNEQLKKISDGDKHSPLKKSVAFGKTTTTDTPPHINRGLGTDKCPKFKVKEMITPTMTKKSKINRVLTKQERDAAFLRAYGKGNCKLAQKEVDKYIDMLYKNEQPIVKATVNMSEKQKMKDEKKAATKIQAIVRGDQTRGNVADFSGKKHGKHSGKHSGKHRGKHCISKYHDPALSQVEKSLGVTLSDAEKDILIEHAKKFPDGGCQVIMKKKWAELNPEKFIDIYQKMPEETKTDKHRKKVMTALFNQINGNKEELIKKVNERKAEQSRIAKEAEEKVEKERQDTMRKTQSEPAIQPTPTPELRQTKSETDIVSPATVRFFMSMDGKTYHKKNKSLYEKYNKLPHSDFYVAKVLNKYNIIKKTTTRPRPYIKLPGAIVGTQGWRHSILTHKNNKLGGLDEHYYFKLDSKGNVSDFKTGDEYMEMLGITDDKVEKLINDFCLLRKGEKSCNEAKQCKFDVSEKVCKPRGVVEGKKLEEDHSAEKLSEENPNLTADEINKKKMEETMNIINQLKPDIEKQERDIARIDSNISDEMGQSGVDLAAAESSEATESSDSLVPQGSDVFDAQLNEIEKKDEEDRGVDTEEVSNINPIVATDSSVSTTDGESDSEETQQGASPKDGFADYLNWFLVQSDMKLISIA